MQYTEFFRRELGPDFQLVFSLAEGAPPWEEPDTSNGLAEYAGSLHLPSIGTATAATEGEGYLYSAVGDATVREIKACLDLRQPAAS